MNQRAYLLWLACAAQALALHLPAAAQGLRVAPAPGAPSGRAPGGQQPPAADYIVAVVNSEPITNNEVRSRMTRLERQFAQQGQGVPPRPQFARQVLERLITEKAQLQYARETGVKVDEALVDQAEQNLARQNQVEVAELRRRLAADGIAPPQFREELRNQIVLTRLRERELESRVKVNDLDVDQFLREQQQASNDPAYPGDQPGAYPGGRSRERHRGADREPAGQGAKAAGTRPRRRGLRQAGRGSLGCPGRRRQRRLAHSTVRRFLPHFGGLLK